MKYFIADPSSDMGIRQIGADTVAIRKDGSLEYIHPNSGLLCRVLPEHWSTDWDTVVNNAFSRLTSEIEFTHKQLQKLIAARDTLIQASPRLKRKTDQMTLF